MNWYLHVLRNYANFNGRARRKEYWMFTLFNFIVGLVLSILDMAIFGTNILAGLYSLFILIPSIAVTIRRLHDTDRSGWWILLAFVPLIGGIVLLVFMCLSSTPDNRFGPNPKNMPEPEFKHKNDNNNNSSRLVN